jgi:uncharacterized protein
MALREALKRHALLTYFVLTFVLTWLCWITLDILLPNGFQSATSSSGASHPSALVLLFLLGNIVPSSIGILLTRIVAGRGSLRALFSQVVRWRVNPGWYGVVLLLPPLLTIGALALAVALGSGVPALSIAAIVGGLAGAFVAPLGEEFGWRGFALPRLQAQRSALGASIVLGLLWGLWHVPIWIWEKTASPTLLLPDLGLRILIIAAFGVLMTWVYNNTGGSLLLMILFHLSIVMTSYYPFPQPLSTGISWVQTLLYLGLLWAVVLVVVVAYGPGRFMRRRASDHLQEAVAGRRADAAFPPDGHVL